MGTGNVQGGGTVEEVLDRLEAAVRDLLELDLFRLGDAALLDLAKRSEVLARQVWAGQVHQVAQIDERRLFCAHGASSTAVLLRQDLRLSPGQANTRVKVARTIREVIQPSGAATPPELPIMADLLDTGELNEECCGIIARFLTGLPTDIDAATRDLAEETLVDQACMCDAATLRRVVKEVEVRIDPDGKLAKEATNRMTLEIGNRGHNGLTRVTGKLDDLTVERLKQAIMGLAAPQPGPNGERDQRSAGQRQAHAFSEVLSRFLLAGKAPSHGGIRPQVMVVMTLADFIGGTPVDKLNLEYLNLNGRPGGDRRRDADAVDGTDASAEMAGSAVEMADPAVEVADPAAEMAGSAAAVDGSAVGSTGSAGSATETGAEVVSADTGQVKHTEEPVPEGAVQELLSPGSAPGSGEDWRPNLKPADRGSPLSDPALGSACPRASYGGAFDLGTARRIACDSRIIPVVLGGDSMVLDVGRERRSVPPAIRKAATVRDLGCTFPACTVPAEWCDGHHVIPWSRGGPTSLDNCALLCGYHHTLIHQGHWIIRMAGDGHPEFLPPSWMDPYQRPLRNLVHRPQLTR